MTLLGAVFSPLAIACFLLRPFYLLPLLVVASVFEAGSVVNGVIGDFEFGIQPFYLIEILIVLRLVMLGLGPAKLLPRRESPMRTVVILLFAFWLWSVSSAFVMPHLFAGILVSVPRNGGDAEFSPLVWNLSNLVQAGYLTLNVGTAVYALHIVRTRLESEQLIKALYWAAFIVVLIGFLQFAAEKGGWDFPYETFNSNPGYAMGFQEDIGSVHRFNSTFVEPSFAGSYLAATTCGLLASFLAGRSGIGGFVGLFGLTAMLFLTTSTTGFAALAIGVSMLLAYFNPFRGHQDARRSSSFGWVVILVGFAIVGCVLILTPELGEAVLTSTLEKGESQSFWFRLANEFHSIELLVETYGLGVGLGGNRSSGLIPTILSSVGIVGAALFTAMLFKISRLFPGRSARSSLQMGFWALVTMIISEIVAVPDLNRPVLWGFLTLVLCQLNVDLDLRASVKPAQLGRIPPRRPPLRRSPSVAAAN
jgi:hypothetical protein